MNLSELITDVRAHFAAGGNAAKRVRELKQSPENEAFGILLAYDLQAGTYVKNAQANPDRHKRWCEQTVECLKPYASRQMSILEVGCGECTTLQGVLDGLCEWQPTAYGFDISWSRVAIGRDWLTKHQHSANLFVADLEHIPLADASIDVVYSSHSLEPNGGREPALLKECLRVARDAVVLIEPIAELGDDTQRARMREHGYICGLRDVAKQLSCTVVDYRRLPFCTNPLNPTGLLVLRPPACQRQETLETKFLCPVSSTPLFEGEAYFAPQSGLVYPSLKGLPLLRACHSVIASLFDHPSVVQRVR